MPRPYIWKLSLIKDAELLFDMLRCEVANTYISERIESTTQFLNVLDVTQCCLDEDTEIAHILFTFSEMFYVHKRLN